MKDAVASPLQAVDPHRRFGATLTDDRWAGVWEGQRTCPDALESGDDDIVAFLAGHGSGTIVRGTRWTITCCRVCVALRYGSAVLVAAPGQGGVVAATNGVPKLEDAFGTTVLCMRLLT